MSISSVLLMKSFDDSLLLVSFPRVRDVRWFRGTEGKGCEIKIHSLNGFWMNVSLFQSWYLSLLFVFARFELGTYCSVRGCFPRCVFYWPLRSRDRTPRILVHKRGPPNEG